jgi:hypothetical protein
MKVVQKIKTHILCSTTFFRKSHRLWDNVEKCGGHPRGHKWSHKMAHTSCVLDYQDYMHLCACTRPRALEPTSMHARTHIPITNTYCFSTAKMIRERASVLRYRYIACLVYKCLGLMSELKLVVNSFHPGILIFLGYGCWRYHAYQLYGTAFIYKLNISSFPGLLRASFSET